MSFLTIVRHAQASFFADEYDQLSPLGETQACRLGEYLVRSGQVVDEVYSGPRSRQRRTAELVGACYEKAGLAWPPPVVLPDFDEYDLGGMQQGLLPELVRRDAEFARLVDGYRQSRGGPDHAGTFQKMFEVLTLHWLTDPEALDGVESWPAFRARVERGLRSIRERPGRGRRVVLFTSGGVIGTAVHLALGAPDRAALELNWRVRNCSLTEFVFTRERLTLDAFNTIPHLVDRSLWTYR